MTFCTLGEAMIYNLARTLRDGTLAFHGFGSPLVQLALHVAKQTFAPSLVVVAGATYALNPRPPFLPPTSNDWVLDRDAEASLDIEALFDLAASGRMGRMFLSGAQLDQYGNSNVTRLGGERLALKLPGGGGGCNLSCDADHITLWTAAHRSPPGPTGKRRFRLVERCDFVTNLGHRGNDGRSRAELGHRGRGPDWLVTELGLFDFDAEGVVRLRALHPDVSADEVAANTGFALRRGVSLEAIPLPDASTIAIVRALDPLKVHERELSAQDRQRRFSLGAAA
jgi:glutaconate CoA-transferase, subunit B